jgi:4'-phosphopantetheinyl transferase
VLSPEELDRAARISGEHIRRRYVLGRAALRRLLGERLGVPPAALRFDYGERGKPHLQGAEVNFNLSHSGNLALIAISDRGPVGVDLEQLQRRRRLDLLSQRVLTEHERELLDRARAEGNGVQWFFRCWTAKEAVAKAFGLGLTLAPSRIGVIPDGANRALVEVAPATGGPLPGGAEPLEVCWLPGLDHAVGAVAANGGRLEGGGWRRLNLV